MWAEESIFYQIYPLGFCGAPYENDGTKGNGMEKVAEWIPHLEMLGVDAVYFSPVFESDRHGYDTRDYLKIDNRLGDNASFAELCKKLHEKGIKVVLDGVFNHVGRGFWAFQDVLAKREASEYKDWFHINFGGNSNYNDGLWYEGWEGHYELVKLNLKNQVVIDYLFSAIQMWVDQFEIDGLRLDVAYCLDHEFIKKLRQFAGGLKPDFLLLGEMLFGDYNQLVNDQMLHSGTNYECYKGIYSSFNEGNMHEISYSLNRQFGKENWCIYRGKHLLCFLDNHDVTRIGSMLIEKKHLPLAYGLLFTMPGIPCIYYGSEWGALGTKAEGDDALRPCFNHVIENNLTAFLAKLTRIRKSVKAFSYGDYTNVLIRPKQLVFERTYQGERILVLINAEENPFSAMPSVGTKRGKSLWNEEEIDFTQPVVMPAFSFDCIKLE